MFTGFDASWQIFHGGYPHRRVVGITTVLVIALALAWWVAAGSLLLWAAFVLFRTWRLHERQDEQQAVMAALGTTTADLPASMHTRMAEDTVPNVIRDVRILTLDMGLLQAGAGVKGEFEQRLKNVIDEVQASSVPILLFIDEAHTLIGAGNSAGDADAANLLKPVLARG